MHRRNFLKGMGLAVTSPYWIRHVEAIENIHQDLSIQFSRALKEHSWLIGFQGVDKEVLRTPELKVTGKIPNDLSGTFYRNGPAQFERFGMRYHHWFDGEGMFHRYQVDGQQNKISHLGKIIKTKKFIEEEKAQRIKYNLFGTRFNLSDAENGVPTEMSQANISVMKHREKLIALWEGGPAYEIDPKSLDTLGEYRFSDETEGFPVGPHPRYDSQGNLWMVGYQLKKNPQYLILYHQPVGKGLRYQAIPVDNISYFHDMLITENYLVLPLAPLQFKADEENQAIIRSYKWYDQAMRVMVFDKYSLEVVKTFELPPQFVFHFGNAYEEKGKIVYDSFRYNDASLMLEGFSDVVQGKVDAFVRIAGGHHLVTLDLRSGVAREEPLTSLNGDFPSISPKLNGMKNTKVCCVENNGKALKGFRLFNRLVWRDLTTGKSQNYDYSEDDWLEEHIFIDDPKRGGEEGWIVGTSLDVAKQVTKVNIFDTENIAGGPVAVGTLPYAIPLGFHGKFYLT